MGFKLGGSFMIAPFRRDVSIYLFWSREKPIWLDCCVLVEVSYEAAQSPVMMFINHKKDTVVTKKRNRFMRGFRAVRSEWLNVTYVTGTEAKQAWDIVIFFSASMIPSLCCDFLHYISTVVLDWGWKSCSHVSELGNANWALQSEAAASLLWSSPGPYLFPSIRPWCPERWSGGFSLEEWEIA